METLSGRERVNGEVHPEPLDPPSQVGLPWALAVADLRVSGRAHSGFVPWCLQTLRVRTCHCASEAWLCSDSDRDRAFFLVTPRLFLLKCLWVPVILRK